MKVNFKLGGGRTVSKDSIIINKVMKYNMQQWFSNLSVHQNH